jgi:hypothetical protein
VLHHGIGIDLANWADFIFGFEFELSFTLILVLGFTKEAADCVADGAEPAFPLEPRFEFVLVFQFPFAFARVLIFEFMLD